MRNAICISLAVLLMRPSLAEFSDRHEIEVRLDWTLIDTDSALGAWTEGGHGKLRYDSEGTVRQQSHLALGYTGRLAPELYVHAVLDYNDEATQSLGLTEAFLELRPVPSGPNRHRLKFGAFYPSFSLENGDFAWDSPYTMSFSGINAWIGEEIRPIGVDWRLTRRLGGAGSAHEVAAFAGTFIGNDTAATLLFWRGWSMHDRQTRLNERVPLPTIVIPDETGDTEIVVERQLDPIAEIDDSPGYFLGGDWRFARRVKISLAFWDNRADPEARRDGQWAWGTRFWNLAAQFALPADTGLIAQYMRGDTDWLLFLSPTGERTPQTRLGTDEFESAFVLLSKQLRDRHRISLRYDRFDLWRAGSLDVDRGDAVTLAYGLAVNRTLRLRAEWLEVESRRELWPLVYNRAAGPITERQVLLGIEVLLFDSKT
jgi:hypothetical protein